MSHFGRCLPMPMRFGRADHLIENHDYKFRVFAVNRMGQSEPLAGTEAITAKDPFQKPTKPGQPQVPEIDWHGHSR